MDEAGLARVVAVINGKGGVFKSSLAASLGGLIAQAGWRVLLLDFDPQGNLAEELGLAGITDEGQQQVAAIPNGLGFKPVSTGRDRLDVVCGGEALEDLDNLMAGRQSRDPEWMHKLATSLAHHAGDYDLVLIDCPPGYPTLQTLALVAARYALIPTRSDSSSRKGMRAVARRFVAARNWNPDLELLGVVRTGISVASRQMRAEVRREIEADLGGSAPIFEATIRYAERPSKAVRDTGKLPHELEPDAERHFKERFNRLREQKAREKQGKGAHRRDDTEVVLSPSVGGLAADYADLAQEFLDLLAAADRREMEASA